MISQLLPKIEIGDRMLTMSSPAKTAGTQTGDSCLVVRKVKEVSFCFD